MCTPQIGSRTNSRAPCSACKLPVGVNGSRFWPGCSKPEINRPARRTPHDTITTQNKNLINRAKKVIAYSVTASVFSTSLMMLSEFQSASAERQRRPIAGTHQGRGKPSVCKVKRARQTKRCNFSKLQRAPQRHKDQHHGRQKPLSQLLSKT